MILKGKYKHKGHKSCEQPKTEVYRYLLKKKDGMPTGASPSLDA